jgi:hypothetical protein
MSIWVIMVYLVLTVIGFKKTAKEKNKAEMAVFLIILVASFIFNYFGIVLRKNLPHIDDLIMKAFNPLSELIFGIKH